MELEETRVLTRSKTSGEILGRSTAEAEGLQLSLTAMLRDAETNLRDMAATQGTALEIWSAEFTGRTDLMMESLAAVLGSSLSVQSDLVS